jgi:general stress protein 26
MMTGTHATERPDAPDADVYARLEALTRDVRVAMLTTRAADGTLHSRPMARVGDKGDRTLWFFCSAQSEKCREVEQNAQVNVCFADHANHRYVSLSGRAHPVRDPGLAKQLWSPWLRLWFPRGPEDQDLVLLRVDTQSAECWEAPTVSAGSLLRVARMVLTRQPSLASLIKHERFQFVEAAVIRTPPAAANEEKPLNPPRTEASAAAIATPPEPTAAPPEPTAAPPAAEAPPAPAAASKAAKSHSHKRARASRSAPGSRGDRATR